MTEMVAICPSCASRRCPSLDDTPGLCPELALKNLTKYYLGLMADPKSAPTLARELAKTALRLEALEVAFVKKNE